jgi:hypothetical protein
MKSLLISISLLLLFHLIAGAQQSCTECARNGMLTEFANLHSPDYEQKLKEWQECMILHSGGFTDLDTSNANVRNALKECFGLNPGNRWHCDMSTMSTYIGERFSNQCFHLLSPIFYAPATDKPPEYIFKGSYEAEIEGGRIIEYAEDYKKPIVARMELGLYYNGNSPELVQEWSSENTIPDPWALFNKLKTPKSLSPILKEFEKRPATCEVNIPSPEEFCDKGTGEIVLTGFKDSGGKTSREFNRIVVSIYKGEILNGEDSDYGPDYKVFTVGQGEVKIEYRPPAEKDDGYEWLRVYNSCDILPDGKYPMSRTQPDNLIIDQHFPIICGFYQGTITVVKKWDYTKDHGKGSTRYTGSQTVTYTGLFKPIPQMEEMEGQPVRIFGKGSAKGTWQHEERRYCEGDCDCPGLVYEETGSGSVDPLSMDGITIITNVWPTEDKVVADQLNQFGMVNWYDIFTPSATGTTQSRQRSKNSDGNCEWHNRNTETILTESQVRFKLEGMDNLGGKESWSSSSETTGVSITNLTEAVYDQKPFDPEKDGTDYTYTITWNLKLY